MTKLTIDNRDVTVDNGVTILDAAQKLDIKILTMCFLKSYEPQTSCMICVVKIEGVEPLVPACGTIATDGMKVETSSQEIDQARKAALELLLSDHTGDCMGPCQMICPAKMDIPLMIQQIKAGRLSDAIITVKRDIALPAVLGRICPAPCEKGCRRGKYDQPVSICLLKRYAADVDLLSAQPYLPVCEPKKNKRVAIIGAGPTGLSAAYYLSQKGYACSMYDDHDKLGGMLRYSDCLKKLENDVLDKEIASIKNDVEFSVNTEIDSVAFENLRRDYGAVFVATGASSNCFSLEAGGNGIKINTAYQTNIPNVFAGGDSVRKRTLAVHSANLHKPFSDGSIKWYRNLHIKTSAYKCQAKFFFCFGSYLNAKTAFYTFAGFIDYLRMLSLLAEQCSLSLVSVLGGLILLAVLSQITVVGFAALAMQATRGFLLRLLIGNSFTCLCWRNT